MNRLAAMMLVAICVMLPVFFLSTPDAAASPNGASCDVGQLVNGVCVVDYGPPTCPVGSSLDGDTCVLITDPIVDAECPAGSLGTPGACYILLAWQPGPLVCEQGTLINGQCEERIPAPLSCPSGYAIDPLLGGLCTRTEPASQLPPTCPDGASGVPGACYILVAKVPAGPPFCVDGALVGNLCVIIGNPPLPGPQPCDPGFGLVDGQCIRYEQPVFPVPQCPVGSAEINGDCRKPVADAAGAYYCQSPMAVLNGKDCVFTAAFVFGPCQVGFGLVGSDCVRFTNPVSFPVCPVGSAEINGDCRKPVADVLGAPYCADPGAVLTSEGCELSVAALCQQGTLIDGSCVDQFDPTYYCNGLVVTINMQLGDAGQGTSGDDVILGTDGADTIWGRSGRDVICGQGGDDVIRGGRGRDIIFGDAGDDTLYGGRGADTISGGADNDDIRGNRGADVLAGDSGDDVIRGGRGNDSLDGGTDSDICIGGNGNDAATAACEIQQQIP